MLGDNKDLGFVRRCRDIAEIWLGTRWTTILAENQFGSLAAITQIVKPDPRRIRYEIVLSEISGAGSILVGLSQANKTVGIFGQLAMLYALPASGSQTITRDYRTDGDNVTAAVFALVTVGGGGAGAISVRETLLATLPVDEAG